MKLRIILALALAALAAGSLNAQTGTKASAASQNRNGLPDLGSQADSTKAAAAYDSQALRFESRWGSADIIRGANDQVIGAVGWFRDFDVEKLVQSSPQALIAAREFKADNFRGSLVSTIGASVMAIGVAVASNNSNNASTPMLIIAGAGGIAWGLQHLNRSYSALSRALWWYNRDLGR